MKKFVVTLLALLCAAVLSFAQSGEQAFSAGRTAFEKGDYATAVTKLNEAIKDPVTATKAKILLGKVEDCQKKMAAANSAYNAGNYSEAKAKYQEVLSINPSDPNAKSGVSKCDQKMASGNNNNNNGSGGGVGGNTPTTLSITSPSSRTLSFSASGGSQTIQASSNISLTYVPSSLSGWCTVSQNGKSFTVSASQNNSTSARSGKLTIKTTDGAKSEEFTIKQSAAATTLSVDQPYSKSYNFAASGGSYTIKVSSNTDVKFTQSGLTDWCTFNTNGKEITVTAKANDKTASRSGSVTVRTVNGERSEKINISQDGASATLSLSPTSLSFLYSPSYSKTVNVTTNMSDYTVQSSESWCTVSKSSTSFNVSASTNYSSYRRYATITVKAGDETRTVNVDQDPYPSSSSSYTPSYNSGLDLDANLAFGLDFTMEFGGDPIKYGLGLGGMLRFTLFDDVIMLDSGVRAAYLVDMPDSTDGQNYYYSDDQEVSTDFLLYVPLVLNINLGGFYFGGGYQWDFGGTENKGVLAQIGLTMGSEGYDMRLYGLINDNFYLGLGISCYF